MIIEHLLCPHAMSINLSTIQMNWAHNYNIRLFIWRVQFSTIENKNWIRKYVKQFSFRKKINKFNLNSAGCHKQHKINIVCDKKKIQFSE